MSPGRARVTARGFARTLLWSSVSALALAGAVQAQGPQGGAVVGGAAEISQSAVQTTIRQSTQRATIDWRGFDVSADHTVAFQQPDARSATLNRVTAGGESMIAGRITAPGTVIIQNTAGVVFAGSAKIDTGSLVATSQIVDAARFARDGGLSIGGGEAAGARVRNEGAITVADTGLAALVGGDVSNAGAIVARRGDVVLASGATTTIDLSGDGLARIAVEGDLAGGSSISNSGVIEASGGRVVLSAGAAARAMDGVINTSGLITAASTSGAGGDITLIGRGAGAVRVAGALDASGATSGGGVTATGASVTLTADARVAARGGSAAGGKVRVGGETRGGGATRRAETTAVAAGAEIDVRGARGGEAVVWADGATQFDGVAHAGGLLGGGFIETSGRAFLGVGETASVLTGAGGLWLLDPRDVTIGVAGVAPGAGGAVTPTPGATPFLVSANAVVAALNAGGDVTVTTEQAGSAMAGDLTVARPLNWTGDGSLSLIADRDIVVNGQIQSSGAGSITATAERDVVLNREIITRGSGDVAISAGRAVAVNSTVRAFGSGDIALTALTGDLTFKSDIAGNLGIIANSGDISIATPEGSVLMRNNTLNNAQMQIVSASGDISVAAGDSIILQASPATIGGFSRIGRGNGSGDVLLTARVVDLQGGANDDSGFAGVTAGAGGSVTVLADELIAIRDGDTSTAVIAALNGATLRLEAPRQIWDGRVRSAATDGSVGGGSVLVSGEITAGFRPNINLAADQNFVLAPTSPDGTPSSYTSALSHAVFTRGTGTIDLGGPVQAASLLYESQERVTLRPGATVTGTGGGDAVVIAAGRGFDNQAGVDALRTTAPDARWLTYLNTFAGMLATEPGTVEFDLYGRLYPTFFPLTGFTGDRIVYGETPILVVTVETLSKPFGETAKPDTFVTGLRPRDNLALVLDGSLSATSEGSAANAPVGVYETVVSASLSAQGELQGYSFVVTPGTLTVTAAPVEPPVPPSEPPVLPPSEPPVLPPVLPPVGPNAPVTPAGLGDLIFAATERNVGAPPLSVGDASFRTTVAEAPPALASPFVLTYSFGQIAQNAPAGFVAAAASTDGAATAPAGQGGSCGGPINIGAAAENCEEVVLTESFWTTIADRQP